MSFDEGPQSSAMLPVAGVANAPSVLLYDRPSITFVNMVIRRQFQRAFAGVGFAPASGPLTGAPPPIMTIPPPLIMIGPPPEDPPPLFIMLKLNAAPSCTESCRDRASPSTSTTLANDGSGRTPSIGEFRLLPRSRCWPTTC